MSTELDIAKMMWGWGDSGSSGGSPGSKYGESTSVRYGTVTAVNDDGTVTIKLDGTGELITIETSTPLAVGDRVTIVVQGGQYLVYAMDETIRKIQQQEKDLSEKIVEEGGKILDEVNGQMEEWKADHQLTDSDITHSIDTAVSGATETWSGQLSSVEENIETNYALKTEVSQGIDGLKSEISETYATSEGVQNEINTAIEQASGEISTTVEQNVMNSVGDTYATKTELQQTSEDLTLTINGSIANGYATSGTSSGTAAKTATCNSPGFSLKSGFALAVKFTYGNTASSPTLNVNGTGARSIRVGNSTLSSTVSWDAGDTILFIYDGSYWQLADPSLKSAKTVESYFTADATGLEVGQIGETSSVKMASSGKFQVLENGSSVLDIYSGSGGAKIVAPSDETMTISNSNASNLVINASGYQFSSMYSGFSVNTSASVETRYIDVGGSTSNVSKSFAGINSSFIRKIVIYYHCTYNNQDYGSVRVEMRSGDSKSVNFTSVQLGSSPAQMIICMEANIVQLSGSTVTITRVGRYRAAINSSGVQFNSNPTDLRFAIDGIAACVGTGSADN